MVVKVIGDSESIQNFYDNIEYLNKIGHLNIENVVISSDGKKREINMDGPFGYVYLIIFSDKKIHSFEKVDKMLEGR